MNKTIDALKLAEEALEKVKKLFRSMTADECPDDPYISVGEALAAIREALADHVAASGKVIAEQEKQEQVAWAEMMLTGGKWGEASCAHCNRSLGAAITCPYCGFINAHVDSDDKSTNLCQNSLAKRQMQPAECAAAIRGLK